MRESIPDHSAELIRTHAFRLEEGADLRESIDRFVAENGIEAGTVAACVGGLKQVRLRQAPGNTVFELNQRCEFTGITGTVGVDGCHLHGVVSDQRHLTHSGHLTEGNIVWMTMEVVVHEYPGL